MHDYLQLEKRLLEPAGGDFAAYITSLQNQDLRAVNPYSFAEQQAASGGRLGQLLLRRQQKAVQTFEDTARANSQTAAAADRARQEAAAGKAQASPARKSPFTFGRKQSTAGAGTSAASSAANSAKAGQSFSGQQAGTPAGTGYSSSRMNTANKIWIVIIIFVVMWGLIFAGTQREFLDLLDIDRSFGRFLIAVMVIAFLAIISKSSQRRKRKK